MKIDLQHWRGYTAIFTRKAAPMLEFTFAKSASVARLERSDSRATGRQQENAGGYFAAFTGAKNRLKNASALTFVSSAASTLAAMAMRLGLGVS